MKNAILITFSTIAGLVLLLSLAESWSQWFIWVTGLLSLVSCSVFVLVISRLKNTDYLSLSQNLVFWFNLFILGYGVERFIHVLSHDTSTLDLILNIVVSTIMAIAIGITWKTKVSVVNIPPREELLQMYSVLRLHHEKIQAGLWWLDLADNKVKWSPGMYRIYDLPEGKEVRLEELDEMVHPSDLEKYMNSRSKMKKGVFDPVSYRITTSKGIKYVLGQSYGEYHKGKLLRTYGSLQDITKQVLSEQTREIEFNQLKVQLHQLQNEKSVESFKNAMK